MLISIIIFAWLFSLQKVYVLVLDSLFTACAAAIEVDVVVTGGGPKYELDNSYFLAGYWKGEEAQLENFIAHDVFR